MLEVILNDRFMQNALRRRAAGGSRLRHCRRLCGGKENHLYQRWYRHASFGASGWVILPA
jgi:hypothetical protein